MGEVPSHVRQGVVDLVKDTLAGSETVTLQAQGSCMAPVIANAASLHMRKACCYWPGDVVVYFCATKRCLVVHRFLGYVPTFKGIKCLIKADNGSRPDPLVAHQEVLGKWIASDVTLRIRLRSTFNYLRWWGWALLIKARTDIPLSP